MRRALYAARHASWLWQEAVDRALEDLSLFLACTSMRLGTWL